jgi:hypothetical protein
MSKEHALRSDGRLKGGKGVGESDEEGITFDAGHATTESNDFALDQPMVIFQNVRIAIAEPNEEACRSFDVGKQEGEGAGRLCVHL